MSKSIPLNKQDLKAKNTFNRGNNYLAPILSVLKYLYTMLGFPAGSAVKNPPAMLEMHGFHSWVRKIP